ncbi:hypothetical protein L1887_10904 [Cichorium endivia]|nr:hypothetical protein L1887_10904 [Cichorium endivia]
MIDGTQNEGGGAYVNVPEDDCVDVDDSTSVCCDFIMEENTLVDDIDVEMGEVHSVVDLHIEFPSLQQITFVINDSNDDFLGVLDNEMFESAGTSKDPSVRMLNEILKSIPYSSCEVQLTHPGF